MQLNEVTFGNPNRQHLIYLETENYLDFRIPEYPDYRLLEKQINDLYSDYI